MVLESGVGDKQVIETGSLDDFGRNIYQLSSSWSKHCTFTCNCNVIVVLNVIVANIRIRECGVYIVANRRQAIGGD